MKILHLAHTYAPMGGIETYIIELATILEAAGHKNVVIYRQKHSQTPVVSGRNVYRVSANTPHTMQAEITRIIQDEAPDVVYMHAVYNTAVLESVSKLVPTVVYVHGFVPVCPGLGKYYRRTDTICERAFGLGCVPMIYLNRCATACHPKSVYRIMASTKKQLRIHQSLSNVVVASAYMRDLMIQNGFSTENITILPPHFEKLHPPISAQTEPPLLLFVGRLEREKGLPYLLQAMAQLNTNCRLNVIGEGTQRETYETLARNLSLHDRVAFLGWVKTEALHTFYERTSLLIMSTIMPEPFGKVGIEAMSYGKPVVAFNVGGIVDWLCDAWNGLAVSPRDSLDMALKIDRLLQDAQLAAYLGANARLFVRDNFSPQKHIQQLLTIFERAIRNYN